MKIVKKMGMVYDRIIDAAVLLAGIMVVFLMLSVSLEVALRYFWGRPTSWVGEIAGYILLYIPFLVAAWVLKRDGHVKMDLLLERLDPKTQCLLNVITSVTSAAICLVLTWFGLRSSLYFYNLNYKTPTVLMLPKALIIGIIFVGCFLLSIQFLRRAYGYWKDWTRLRFHGACDIEESL